VGGGVIDAGGGSCWVADSAGVATRGISSLFFASDGMEARLDRHM
jgi:hypothetical protein